MYVCDAMPGDLGKYSTTDNTLFIVLALVPEDFAERRFKLTILVYGKVRTYSYRKHDILDIIRHE